MYHNLSNCEILVVDNYGDDMLKKFIKEQCKDIARYEKFTESVGSSCAKNKVFELAQGDMVMCIDSHTMLVPGSLKNIPITDDLIQGPMVYNDLKNFVWEWKPVWRGHMWGVWGDYSEKLPSAPVEIWGCGGGLLLTKKSTWLGFNPKFRGFGGEEGYIHEKYRKAGRKVWSYPNLIWMHQFERKIPYPLHLTDRVINYIVGFEELQLDLNPIKEHFGQELFEKALIEARKR
jgi:hypothetical protein